MDEVKRVVIVGFDGLDKKVIEELELENLIQKEFGFVDINDESPLITPKLWSHFLTGSKDSGIEKMHVLHDEKLRKYDQIIEKALNLVNRTGINLRKGFWKTFFDQDLRFPDKRELTKDSLLDRKDAESVKFPGYDEYIHKIPILQGLTGTYSKSSVKFEIDADHQQRLKNFKEVLSEKEEGVVMVHFHKPDEIQHLYFNDKQKVEDSYQEMNEIAGMVKESAGENDLVLFLSDHGLNTVWNNEHGTGMGSHNFNSFYSCNTSLFEDQPKLVDFKSKIERFLPEEENPDKLSGVDI